MDENDSVEEEVVEKTTSKFNEKVHDFPKTATGFVFGYVASKLGEHLYDVALKVIREKRLAKLSA